MKHVQCNVENLFDSKNTGLMHGMNYRVVVNSSALPDPKQVNYDVLLSRVLSYLDLYVESDYTVIFFAAGVKHTPGWNWVWKAYRSLSRKYRKNLKRLYVVHSTFFSKMLFSLAGAVISPKFFRKLTYVSTLSELAYHIPITQIDIPPAAYAENLKHESTITLPSHHTFSANTPHAQSTPTQLFGIPLEELMGLEGEKGGVPRVIRDAIAYIRESGAIQEEGIFRRSPNSAMLKSVVEAYDRGNVVSLDTFNDPHLAAVLIKKYLRDLPEPVFPESMYPVIRRCPLPSFASTNGAMEDAEAVRYIREVLLVELQPCVYILLSAVLQILHETSLYSSHNRMDAYNLAVVIAPNLTKGNNPARDVLMCIVQGGPNGASQSPTSLQIPQSMLGPSSNPSSPSSPTTPRVSIIESTPNATPSHSPPTSPAVPPGLKATSNSSSPPVPANTNTTLGTVIKLCIERYYEVFDEVNDPTEAILPPSPFASSPAPAIPEEGEFMSANGRVIGRGFGFGMDMELSESESEGDGAFLNGGGMNGQGKVDMEGFRFGAGAGAGGTVSRALSSATKRLSLSVNPEDGEGEDRFDTDVVLFEKIHQHHRRQSSGLRSHRSHRSTHSARSTGTTGTTDDEEIDDAMLVMPIGPPSPRHQMFLLHQQQLKQQQQGGPSSTSLSPTSPPYPPLPNSPNSPTPQQGTPPTSWGAQRFSTVGSNYATYKRKRAPIASFHPPSAFQAVDPPPRTSSQPASIHSHSSSNNGSPFRARSVVSVENGRSGFGGSISGIGKGGGGSITIGRGTARGTTRKSVGAAVEAVGITAEGFFTAPSSGPVTAEPSEIDEAEKLNDPTEDADPAVDADADGQAGHAREATVVPTRSDSEDTATQEHTTEAATT